MFCFHTYCCHKLVTLINTDVTTELIQAKKKINNSHWLQPLWILTNFSELDP